MILISLSRVACLCARRAPCTGPLTVSCRSSTLTHNLESRRVVFPRADRCGWSNGRTSVKLASAFHATSQAIIILTLDARRSTLESSACVFFSFFPFPLRLFAFYFQCYNNLFICERRTHSSLWYVLLKGTKFSFFTLSSFVTRYCRYCRVLIIHIKRNSKKL